jgi:type I restriction enzyme S subunit
MKSERTAPSFLILQTFFQNFDQFTGAPNAVATMRKLILKLAVQGRLKSEGDELKIPQVRLDSLGSWAQGCGFPVAEQGYADRPILFSKVSDMNLPGNEREILKTNHTIDEAAAKRLRIKVHPPGTVIFPKIGGAIATNKRRVLVRPTAIDNNCSGIIPNESCSTHWLFLVLSAIDFAAYQSGTSVPAVNQGALGEIEVSLPPLAEQKRIVAKVDELMALCDRLEAQQQERETRHAALARASLARFADLPTPANLDFLFHSSFSIQSSDLRKSILNLAVQGKLVPQDPKDEPAESSVGRNEKLSADAPFEIPDQWKWAQLSQLAEINGGFAFKSTAYTDEGTRVVRISDFDEYGFKDHKVVRYPFSPDIQKFTLAESNILMAMTGGTVGKSYFVKSLPEPMVVNQRVATIKVSESTNPSYVDIAIRSEMTQEVIRKAKNSTNDNISMGDIKGFAIPLPPPAEQRRIVAKVDQLMALVDTLETQLAASRATAANLLEALVAELTAQV